MKSSKNILIIVGLVLVAIFLFFVTGNDKDSEQTYSYSVNLEATTDKQIYQSGEEVSFVVDITNTSEVATCISDTSQGNITFLSITRDGQAVDSRTVHADALEALSEFVRVDLQEVEPGAQATISLTSSYDPGIEAQALHTSEVDGIYADATFYSIQEPGSYEVQVVYEYPGEASDDCSAVFQGQTNNATVNFVVE